MNPVQTPASKAPRLAADVAKPLTLSETAAKQLAPRMTPRQFFDTLAAIPALADDAIRFLAAALPKREAVWWGILCVKEGLANPLDSIAGKAVAAAEAWVKDPSEANRRAAGSVAEAAGYGTAAGCLAAATFWSGGSLNPPNLPVVAPRDELTGTAVAGAVLLASIATPLAPEAAKSKFLALGADVASGKMRI